MDRASVTASCVRKRPREGPAPSWGLFGCPHDSQQAYTTGPIRRGASRDVTALTTVVSNTEFVTKPRIGQRRTSPAPASRKFTRRPARAPSDPGGPVMCQIHSPVCDRRQVISEWEGASSQARVAVVKLYDPGPVVGPPCPKHPSENDLRLWHPECPGVDCGLCPLPRRELACRPNGGWPSNQGAGAMKWIRFLVPAAVRRELAYWLWRRQRDTRRRGLRRRPAA